MSGKASVWSNVTLSVDVTTLCMDARGKNMRRSLVAAALAGLVAAFGLAVAGPAQAATGSGSVNCSTSSHNLETCEVWSVAGTGTVAHFRNDTLMADWFNSGTQTRTSYHGPGQQIWEIVTGGSLNNFDGSCILCAHAPPGTLC